MKNKYQILQSKSNILQSLGFEIKNITKPNEKGFGMAWYHPCLEIHFGINWSRMDSLVTSCNIKEHWHFKPLSKSLDEYGINYDLNLLYYSNTEDNLSNTDAFNKTLEYNLRKLGELAMVL